MSQSPKPSGPHVEATLARAKAFAEKLLGENARLRKALAASHAGTLATPARAAEAPSARERRLEDDLTAARAEIEHLQAVRAAEGTAPSEVDAARIAELSSGLADLKRRHAELEEQNNNLANLYVASYQLHSSLDFKEVIAIVNEIVINLIGAEVFALQLLDGRTGELAVIAVEGMERPPSTRIRVGDGPIGTAAQTGQPYYRTADEPGEPDFLHPLAAVPLKIQDDVIGVITVLKLLPQKAGFTQVDYELFNLLAGHAATAIFSSKLYSESERKLTTIQSFLNLLTAT